MEPCPTLPLVLRLDQSFSHALLNPDLDRLEAWLLWRGNPTQPQASRRLWIPLSLWITFEIGIAPCLPR